MSNLRSLPYNQVGANTYVTKRQNASAHCLVHIYNHITFLYTDKSLEVSVSTISSTSLHITAQPPLGLDMVEVKCMLTSKENSSYIGTVSLNNTTDEGAQKLADNLSPYTNYTATCQVFKDGVDQCYIGSDTTQTYTDGKC